MPTKKKHDFETYRMARSIDDLAMYEDYCLELLPMLRRMIYEKWTPAQIRKKMGTYATARTVQLALMGKTDRASTLAACKDVLDRHEGKAISRVETKTQYSKMSQEEMGALMYQKLVDAGVIGADGTVDRDILMGRKPKRIPHAKATAATPSDDEGEKN